MERERGALLRWPDDEAREVARASPSLRSSSRGFDPRAHASDGGIAQWRAERHPVGRGDYADQPTLTPSGIGIAWTGASMGRFHLCATTAQRTIRCAGKNAAGELGIGDTQRRNVLTEVAFP